MRALVALLLLLSPAAALAQSAEDKAAASQLFEDGKRLRDAGKLDEACPKFQGAQRLAPTLGRKLNLADCYRRAGKTASAWAEFKEGAAQAAREHDDDREQFARQAVKDLEKTLSRLTIKLSPGADVAGLEVKRDGVKIDRALLDSGVPVDPGSHVVDAAAPGHSGWSTKIQVGDAAAVTVEIPVLGQATHYTEPAPSLTTTSTQPAPVAATSADTGEPSRPGRNRRIIALVVGGAGVAALGAGVVFGLSAKSKNDDAHNGHCDGDNVCDQAGYDLVKDAQSAATISTITAGIGLAAIAGGVILYLTAPKDAPAESHAGLRVTPGVGAGVAGVSLSGGF